MLDPSLFFTYIVLGYCAEFDVNAAVVQENYNADCKTHNPPRPEYYDSMEAYKCKATSYFLYLFSWLNSKHSYKHIKYSLCDLLHNKFSINLLSNYTFENLIIIIL